MAAVVLSFLNGISQDDLRPGDVGVEFIGVHTTYSWIVIKHPIVEADGGC